MSIQRYRKKPVVIEAMRWDGSYNTALALAGWGVEFEDFATTNGVLFLKTLEGTMRASQWDYIIKDTRGEFYPCRSDIFEATYEVAK